MHVSHPIGASLLFLRADLAIVCGDGHHGSIAKMLQQIRSHDPNIFILVISTTAKDAEFVRKFLTGADDVVSQPLSAIELGQHIESLLLRGGARPAQSARDQPLVLGDFSLDPSTRTLFHARRVHTLGPIQALILQALMQFANQTISREDLENRAGLPSQSKAGVGRRIDNYILQLRRLIEQRPSQPRHLLTVRSKGYRFVIDGECS